jgi:hypothetical protein
MFGHNKEEVAGGLRRLHIEELHNLYVSPNILLLLLLSLAPQPSLGLGLLHKIQLNFWMLLNNFLFYMVRFGAPRPTPIPEDQASVFISPKRQGGYPSARRMGLLWHITRIGERELNVIFWLENLNGRDHSEDLGVDGRTIFE